MNSEASYCLDGGGFRFITPNVFVLFLLICHKELLPHNAPEDNKMRGGGYPQTPGHESALLERLEGLHTPYRVK